MRRVSLVLAAILLVSALLLAGCSSPAPAPAPTSAPSPAPSPVQTQTYNFTYSNFFPPTHLHSILAEMWISEINKRTNGAVVIDYFPGGSLTAGAKIVDGVVTNISDIGMTVVSYTAGRFPAAELVEMPHGYTSGYVASMVANDFYNQFKPEEFKDLHVLYFHAHGPGLVLTTKNPVRKLEDLNGMVLRSTGVGAKIATALGASGYAAAQNEAYELMSKGVIGGSLSPAEVLEGWKQAEVVNYVTNSVDIGYTANMLVVMNKAKWDSLPADIQKVFNEVNQEWIESHARVWTHYDKSAMDFFKTFPNREVIELPADEMARWVDAVQPLINSYLEELKGKGLPADEYEKFINERAQYWAEKAPSAEECSSWVKDNVKK